MKKLSELWQSYAANMLPPSASDTQRRETRRAFYAGALSIFNVIVENLTEDPEPQEEDVRMLETLEEELSAFAQAVRDGKDLP
jgi:hypothetical protein